MATCETVKKPEDNFERQLFNAAIVSEHMETTHK